MVTNKSPLSNAGIWAYQPVDPRELAHRLARALDIDLPNFGDDAQAFAEWMIHQSMPSFDLESSRFRDLYLFKEVLRKCPDWDLGIDTGEAALTAWLSDERLNAATNDRLYTVKAEDLPNRRLLWLAAEKIHAVLGRFDVTEFLSGWRFGPGSTLSLGAAMASVREKLSNKALTVSRDAKDICWEAICRAPAWKDFLTDGNLRGIALTVCDYDRWAGVPKNAEIDRSIGIPPDGNVMMQLSLGRMLRKRLYRSGINLQDQSINQRRAILASADGADATVDVRAASQSLVSALVALLLSSDFSGRGVADVTWFRVLERLRVPLTLLPDGSLHSNEYFSAMGNGYTFELESLIFWGLSCAVCEELGLDQNRVTVYGDDIILPSDAVSRLQDLFSYVGFGLNMKKSFYTPGPGFRESCGVHALRGQVVNPFYVDSSLKQLGTIVLLANNITRWSVLPGFGRDGRLFDVWQWVLSHLPVEYLSRYHIPLGDTDDGIILDWDECRPACASIENDPPSQYGATPIGWKVRCALIEHRAKAPVFDETAYVEALYHGSPEQKRFRPPKEGICTFERWMEYTTVQSTIPGVDVIRAAFQTNQGSLLADESPFVEDPWRLATSVSLMEQSRVTLDWPRMGPWYGLTSIDGALAFSLPLLSRLKSERQAGGCKEMRVYYTAPRASKKGR